MLPYILLIIAFILLAKGADFFVDGASQIARYCRVSQLFVGLSIAAIGTSAPEAAVSIKASITGVNGIALGNVIGSNITNICLAIGIAALMKPLFFETSTIKKEMPFMVAVTVLMLLFGLNYSKGGSHLCIYSRAEGIIFLLLFIGFIFYLSRMAVKDRRSKQTVVQEEKYSIGKAIGLTIIGGAGIALGGHLAVENAKIVANMWGVSEKVIGITVVAFGTSIPEIVTSIVAVAKGKISIAIGNIVGSNIFNILLVLGIAATISPISIESSVIFDILICLGISLLFLLFSKIGKRFSKVYGIILVICYILYVILLFHK
ncbi:MAG: calcium/sodium antiporter [Candidatus Cloacimonadota bacterium]|nr:calcium/sodium antiporter [Candidatus Cloacimonadota bacterium]